MGIQNLLPLLKDIQKPIKVQALKNSTVVVDAYSWIHKGVFACADKLSRGENTDIYVKYCMKYITLLQTYNIHIIMVFDGRHLPFKAKTEKDRRERRALHKAKAAELLRLNRGQEALSHMRQSIDVTHEMALKVMEACRDKNVDCIVAPFEADAQMAYLNVKGFADYVITEDSDLLLFGCKKVVYKLNIYGQAVLIEKEDIPKALKVPEKRYSESKFRHMCILSGCDYSKGLKGIGLKKAKNYIFSLTSDNIVKNLKSIGSSIKLSNDVEITSAYLEEFVKADLMFQYQPVFDPILKQIVPLNTIDTKSEKYSLAYKELECLELPNEMAIQLAMGNLDPFTLKIVNYWEPNKYFEKLKNESKLSKKMIYKSIWSPEYNPDYKGETMSNSSQPTKEFVFGSQKPICSKSLPQFEFKSSQITEEEIVSDQNDLLRQYSSAENNEENKYKRESTPYDTPTPKRQRVVSPFLVKSTSDNKMCKSPSLDTCDNKLNRSPDYFCPKQIRPIVSQSGSIEESPKSILTLNRNPFAKYCNTANGNLFGKNSGLSQIVNQSKVKSRYFGSSNNSISSTKSSSPDLFQIPCLKSSQSINLLSSQSLNQLSSQQSTSSFPSQDSSENLNNIFLNKIKILSQESREKSNLNSNKKSPMKNNLENFQCKNNKIKENFNEFNNNKNKLKLLFNTYENEEENQESSKNLCVNEDEQNEKKSNFKDKVENCKDTIECSTTFKDLLENYETSNKEISPCKNIDIESPEQDQSSHVDNKDTSKSIEKSSKLISKNPFVKYFYSKLNENSFRKNTGLTQICNRFQNYNFNKNKKISNNSNCDISSEDTSSHSDINNKDINSNNEKKDISMYFNSNKINDFKFRKKLYVNPLTKKKKNEKSPSSSSSSSTQPKISDIFSAFKTPRRKLDE